MNVTKNVEQNGSWSEVFIHHPGQQVNRLLILVIYALNYFHSIHNPNNGAFHINIVMGYDINWDTIALGK